MNLGAETPKAFFRPYFARDLPRLPLHFHAASVYFISALSIFHLSVRGAAFDRKHRRR